MIAKSDLIILTVSTTALAVGIYRWQQGIDAPRVAAAPPPPIERIVDAMPNDPVSAVAGSLTRSGDDATTVATPESGAVRVRRVSTDRTDDAVGASGGGSATAALDDTPVDTAATGALSADSSADVGEALYGRYRIRSGDYLGKLADRFGTSVATLQSINGIDGTTIHVDDELLYPMPAN